MLDLPPQARLLGRSTGHLCGAGRRLAGLVAATGIALTGAVGCNEAGPSDNGATTADAGALPAPGSQGLFADVTLAAGLDFRHRIPGDDLGNIVEAVGAGAAFADLDGDDWLDIVLLGGARSPQYEGPDRGNDGVRIYRNRRDGTFVEITETAGLGELTGAVAVAAADYDGDGDRDLYIVDRGADRLYRNRGDAVFDDVTARAGLGDTGFGIAASFFDMEGDGDLDLFVSRYLEFDPRERTYYAPDGFPGPLAYPAQSDLLYRNLGDGSFEDATGATGLAQSVGRGMSVVTADLDTDGDIDVFVANDATENFLWLNDGDGSFVEAGFMAGVAMGAGGEQTSAMAADLGDVDGDGQLDLTVSDTGLGAVYMRRDALLFVDEVWPSGVGPLCAQYVSWGQNLLDYDNDGDLDLFVANGGLHHLVGLEDQLLRNVGDGRYEEASAGAGDYFEARRVSRASVAGDYDNDGDLDLLVTNLADQPALLRNDSASDNAWITLDLVGAHGRDGFGARVLVRSGGRELVAQSRHAAAYLGQGDPRMHFGLGAGVDTVELIEVRWPDGTTSRLEQVPARQILVLKAGNDE